MQTQLAALEALRGEAEPGALRERLGEIVARLRSMGADADADAAGRVLADALIANAGRLSEATLRSVDEARRGAGQRSLRTTDPRSAEAHAVVATHATAGTRVVVWRGDITTLRVDAIVNAANESGLGCFQPSHRCVDNVIHRAAGPRLREACRAALDAFDASTEDEPLPTATGPLVTPAFDLPCTFVFHVVGPQLPPGAKRATPQQQNQLAACYALCLDTAAANGATSIAFPCISTGLFGYPAADAAHVALRATLAWLTAHPNVLSTIVFDVFSESDEALYRAAIRGEAALSIERLPLSRAEAHNLVALHWLRTAQRVLVCAGAGMSFKPKHLRENVYVDAEAYAARYPWMAQYGYRTAYEQMGMLEDDSVPDTVKWGQWAMHWLNMRYRFAPNAAYGALLNGILAKGTRNYFVHTSNADGCFVRAGFAPDRIYTPQGDFDVGQCLRKCRPDGSVFPMRPVIEALEPLVNKTTGEVPAANVPACAWCGGPVWANVRGGSFFSHKPHDAANARLRAWLRDAATNKESVVVLEVGAGFNTPTVTRFVMEAIVADASLDARLVRVNPSASDASVPSFLSRAGRAVDVVRGVDVVEEWAARLSENGTGDDERRAFDEKWACDFGGSSSLAPAAVAASGDDDDDDGDAPETDWASFLTALAR